MFNYAVIYLSWYFLYIFLGYNQLIVNQVFKCSKVHQIAFYVFSLFSFLLWNFGSFKRGLNSCLLTLKYFKPKMIDDKVKGNNMCW